MDYRALLVKYMKWVVDLEGSDFLYADYGLFTDKEMKELLTISEEAYAATRDDRLRES